ncbi:MAG: ferredoxin [Nocardioides sp.]|uniref:ferredoxin n=1 Tax=Nocardioides nematodiphilus TaxID=2849669 RepID=UPI001CD99A35|nr:ferredoxin [Nocardioides nematodiphilus]MCA1984594.1 ferredoxin [Nocardioides nematodiphilus]
MKITVDLDKCQDHGQCAIAAPVAFRMNDEGNLEYETTVEDSYLDEVEEAADVCPVQAILIGQA